MAERPEDLNLPMAVVSRLMKEALPDSCSVSKEARQAVCRAASVFVLYLTSQANTAAVSSKRKTLSANDVFAALRQIELEEFVAPLQEVLAEHQKRAAQRRQQTEPADGASVAVKQ